jgi:hypothetical protein
MRIPTGTNAGSHRPELDKLRQELLRRILESEQRRKHQSGTHAK